MPFRRIFYYFWQLIKRYKIAFFSQFGFMSGRVIFSSVIVGYIYKNIVDVLNNTALSIQSRYDIAVLFVIALGISFTTSMIMSRYGDFVQFRFVSRMVKDLYDFSFYRFSFLSYNFYVNNFSGSLVAKVKRFAKAFEIINESMSSFWLIIVSITASSIILYFESAKLALYFIITHR